MKIIFLTYDLPYPLDQGGKIRAYHLIKNLAQKHQITLLSFIREERQRQNIKYLQPFCQKIFLFPRMKVFSIKHFLTALKPKLPFPAALYWSVEYQKKLEDLVKQDYDLIHFESFYTSLYLSKKIKIPQVLGTENIEWRVYRDFAKQQKNPFWKIPMLWESWRIKSFEEKTWHQADLCLAVSRENCEEIGKVTGKKISLVSNGVDLGFFQPKQKKLRSSKTILFVGNFTYIQNQDAVRFLVKEIFPLIRRKIKNAQLLIIGRQPTKEIKNYQQENIQVKFDLDDIRQAYQFASLLLAPIRAGSGTKFKILEAMASGVAVITTKIGIEGIDAQEGKQVIVRDNAEDLAAQTIELLSDNKKAEKIGQAGYRLVSQKYSWPKIINKLESVYEKFINEKS